MEVKKMDKIGLIFGIVGICVFVCVYTMTNVYLDKQLKSIDDEIARVKEQSENIKRILNHTEK
jgi:hypothetical protein